MRATATGIAFPTDIAIEAICVCEFVCRPEQRSRKLSPLGLGALPLAVRRAFFARGRRESKRAHENIWICKNLKKHLLDPPLEWKHIDLRQRPLILERVKNDDTDFVIPLSASAMDILRPGLPPTMGDTVLSCLVEPSDVSGL